MNKIEYDKLYKQKNKETKRYSCEKCLICFATKYHLNRHLNKKNSCIPTGDIIHQCQMDKNLTTKEKKRIWRKQKVKCDLCLSTYSIGGKSRHLKTKRHLKCLE